VSEERGHGEGGNIILFLRCYWFLSKSPLDPEKSVSGTA